MYFAINLLVNFYLFMWVCWCHGECVEAGGQLEGIASLLLSRGIQVTLRSSGMEASTPIS